MTAKQISAEEFDRMFDDGEDVSAYVDWDHPVVEPPVATTPKRVNFTMPEWLVLELDAEAERLAISRQAVAVTWLAEKAEERQDRRAAKTA